MAVLCFWVGFTVVDCILRFPTCKNVNTYRSRPNNKLTKVFQRLVSPKDVNSVKRRSVYTLSFFVTL